MRFHNLKIEIVAENFRSVLGQGKERVYSDAEVRSEDNWNSFRRRDNIVALFRGMTCGPDHQWRLRFYRHFTDRSRGIGMTEVDRNVPVSEHELIPEIDPGYNLDTFTLGDSNDCLTHAASRAD